MSKKQVYITDRSYILAKKFSAVMGADTLMEFISGCIENRITELAMQDEALLAILKKELAVINFIPTTDKQQMEMEHTIEIKAGA